jgi:hypothetical protein
MGWGDGYAWGWWWGGIDDDVDRLFELRMLGMVRMLRRMRETGKRRP